MERLRREIWSAMRAAILIGAFATFAYFVMARLRLLPADTAMPARDDSTLAAIFAIVFFWAVANACLRHVREWLQISVGHRVSHRLAVPAIVASTDVPGSADGGASMALEDVEEVSQAVTGPIITAAIDICITPVIIGVMLTLHWSFMLLAFVTGAMRFTVALLFTHLVAQPLKQMNETQTRAFRAMGGTINAAEAVEAMGFLPALARRWASDIHGGVTHMISTQRMLMRIQGVTMAFDLIVGILPILMFGVMRSMGIDSGMSSGLGIIAMMMMPLLISPFATMSSRAVQIARARESWERLGRRAQRQHELASSKVVFPCTDGLLEVERLTVRLPGVTTPVIREMSFRIEAGQVVSVSGPVGCGKSTLLRAIVGVQPPTSGGCFLDGHATWQWDRKDLARYIGYLPQEIGLASGTVAEAIARMGTPDMAMVLDAAIRTGAHQFIAELPQGYATTLTEHTLSAGQRQRVGLARAIYGRPRLVVLDEPGAWMDANGLRQLERLLAMLRQEGTSVFFASHEPDLLEQADSGIVFGPIGTPPRGISRKKLGLTEELAPSP